MEVLDYQIAKNLVAVQSVIKKAVDPKYIIISVIITNSGVLTVVQLIVSVECRQSL